MAKAARKPASKGPRSRAKSESRPGRRANARSGGRSAAAPAEALQDALLDLCAKNGWCDLSLADIAEAAGLDLATAHAIYASKADLLVGLTRATDAAILASLTGDPLEGTPRDRLFDLLMRRFDRLQAHRAGYLTLLHELPQTPLEAAALACQMRRSLRLMLESAGISAAGLKGALRLNGLLAIHLAALRVWAGDDSADLARTMAEIDRRLGQAERLDEVVRGGLKRARAMRQEFRTAKAAE
ncbi:TetR family transcriptional regulator [Dongia mobilis]|uniref:TetR family transcriptional regulator n=1 Tax=Dongia mobilis TaxID=578943 RepID=A0A4V3DEP1_9PROT|nr:hypothetical protein [Dongia mobilis]TDQ82438.1 TetR family transcriptional regulator [Dongia mobilis]